MGAKPQDIMIDGQDPSLITTLGSGRNVESGPRGLPKHQGGTRWGGNGTSYGRHLTKADLLGNEFVQDFPARIWDDVREA